LDNVCNLHSCDNMDNACNVVINMSLSGRLYNYFLLHIHELLKYSDYKKACLPKIKGRISALSSQAKTTSRCLGFKDDIF